MASELSKLIEDQLQKVDEESALPPTEKQRLLSSSLRIKTSPGKKSSKGSPGIVKLSKEQPSPPSISGTSVPVPSGQSWVTDGQGFQWTKWRIAVAVCILLAILIALFVAFTHPSNHHANLTGSRAASQPLLAGSPEAGAFGKAPVQPQGTQAAQQAAVQDPAFLNAPEPGSLLSAPAAPTGSGAAEAASAAHHKDHPHKQHQHKNHPHAHPGQHPSGAASIAAAALGLAPSSFSAAAALPPVTVPPMAPEAAEAWFGTAAPPALAVESPMAAAAAAASADPDSKWFGLTAGIHRAVPGVAVNLTDVHQPVAVQDAVVADANAAFDKLHGGWAQEMQQQQGSLEGIASVSGPALEPSAAEDDSVEWDMDMDEGWTPEEDLNDAAG